MKHRWMMGLITVGLCGMHLTAVAEEPAGDPVEMACALGITQALNGNLDEAEQAFTSMLSRSPGDARALSNLGNVHLLRGDYELARVFYEQARAADSEDPGIRLNQATLYMVTGDDDTAVRLAAQAVTMAGGEAEAAYLLGLTYGDADKAADRTRISQEEVRALLQSALEDVPETTAVADSASMRDPDQDAPKKKLTLRSAGSRAADQPDNETILYWKR